MLKAVQVVSEAGPVEDTLTLPFELRQRSRLVAKLSGGREILIQLPRGTTLRGGALLRTNEDTVIKIAAAPEALSRVSHPDPTLLARAAYHLGNRHVPLQIEEACLSYQRDHVLDDMLRGLGLAPEHVERSFEPESGAYAHGAHSHHQHLDHEHADHEH